MIMVCVLAGVWLAFGWIGYRRIMPGLTETNWRVTAGDGLAGIGLMMLLTAGVWLNNIPTASGILVTVVCGTAAMMNGLRLVQLLLDREVD